MKVFIGFAIFFASSIALGQGAEQVGSGFIQMIMKYVDLVAQLVMALSVLATVVVRLIPGEKDDESIDSIVAKARKYLGYLPTFGINPRTKQLEAALENLKREKAKVVAESSETQESSES